MPNLPHRLHMHRTLIFINNILSITKACSVLLRVRPSWRRGVPDLVCYLNLINNSRSSKTNNSSNNSMSFFRRLAPTKHTTNKTIIN